MATVAQAGPPVAAVSRPATPAGRATPPAPQPSAVVVLDTTGFWRMHNQLRPPLLDEDLGPKPILLNQRWLDRDTEAPPKDWRSVEFDDSGWVRAPALRACRTPYLARLCLRGRFEVTDPQKVRGLKVAVGFHGGAIVYVNGKEIARASVPAPSTGSGQAGDGESALAEPYPAEAFVLPNGDLIRQRQQDTPERSRRLALWERATGDILVPAERLRKGVNVLAVEIVRAPYGSACRDPQGYDGPGKPPFLLTWNTCEVRRVQLSAESADGLTLNAVRPTGLQVWNSDLLMSDFDLDWGDRSEPLRPVKIVAARNGTFSGKVVVGSDAPVHGLKATVGGLKGAAGTIPSSAIQVRYAIPWGEEWVTIPWGGQTNPYPRAADVLGALAEAPLAEFPVRGKPPAPPRRDPNLAGEPAPVYGAVVPVWITVTVPPDAKPGAYTGTVHVEAQGSPPVNVPVELNVADWSLPNSQDYRAWVELIESPDTLAMEYGVPLWSPSHWKMIDQAFRYIGQTGSRVVYVPLIAQTNLGHEQSMVRWVRKPGDGNQYDYDFAALDRYLDSAVKNMGTPKIVCFWVWDIYLLRKDVDLNDKSQYLKLLVEMGYIQGPITQRLKASNYDPNLVSPETFRTAGKTFEARKEFLNKGPLVTVLDPVTGKTEEKFLPRYDDPASKALWAPLLAKIQERMKARGLEKAMMFGVSSDFRPTKEEVTFFHDLCPDVPWVHQSHGGVGKDGMLHGVAKVAYQVIVWTLSFPAEKSLYGWRSPTLLAHYDRNNDPVPRPPTFWVHMVEADMSGSSRGVGRLGADLWPAVKDKAGKRIGPVGSRYPQSAWRNLDLRRYALAPGSDGPLSTPHLEYLREGVELCEARIFLEQALLDKDLRARLGEELAQRCQTALDERQTAMVRGKAHLQVEEASGEGWITAWRSGNEIAGHIWFLGSGWQKRSRALFALAGEVERKLK